MHPSKKELVVLGMLLLGQLQSLARDLRTVASSSSSTLSPLSDTVAGNGDSIGEQTVGETSDSVLQGDTDSMPTIIPREVSSLHTIITKEDSTLHTTITKEVSTLYSVIPKNVSTLHAIISRKISITKESSPHHRFNLSTSTTSASDSDCISVTTDSGPDIIVNKDGNDYEQVIDVRGHVGETPIAWTLLCLSLCSVVTNSLSIVVHRKKAIALATFLTVQSGADILQACLTTFIQLPVFFPPIDEVGNSMTPKDTTVPFTIIRSIEMTFQRVSLALSTLICVDRFIHLSNPLQSHTSIQRYSKSVVALVLAFVYATGGFEFYALYMENARFIALRTQTNNISNGTGDAQSCRAITVSTDVQVSKDMPTFLPDRMFNMGSTGMPDDLRMPSERGGQSSPLNLQARSKVSTDISKEVSTKDIIEGTTGGHAKRATADTTERATDDTTERATADSTEGATADTTEETTEGSTEGTTNYTTEIPTEGSFENTAEVTTEDTTEGAIDTTEGTTENNTEGTTEDTTERSTEDTYEGTTEDTTERSTADTSEGTTEDTTKPITDDNSVGTLEAICQKVALLTNVLVYLALVLIIVLNTATLIALKKHAHKNRKLGVGGMGQRQTLILTNMTAVYVTLALPYMSLSLVRNLRIWSEFDIAGKQAVLFIIMVKCASIFEQLKNISDFVVFMVMSRVFRSSLLSAVCKQRRTAQSRSTCTTRQESSVIGQSEDTFTSRF